MTKPAPLKEPTPWFSWFKKLVYLWVRSKCLQESPKDLRINPEKPICYILKSNLITDRMVLDHHCQALGLPRAFEAFVPCGTLPQASYLYLVSKGILRLQAASNPLSSLEGLIQEVKNLREDIQLVPVSVFWGRNPGKEEKSLFKLLFFDDENGGVIQRFFNFLAHGKEVLCHFGEPISLLSQIEEAPSRDDLAKKIRRVLKVHFRKQRDAILGPHIYDYNQVIKSVLTSKNVKDVILKDSSKKNGNLAISQARARKYLIEIAAKQSHHVVRFFDLILNWLWKKVYDGIEVSFHSDLKVLAENYELVYVPCHRSHMDYLLLGYTLYEAGLMPPHTAAGINLNFWPAGSLLRRGGGFFIRRSFAGNRLYAVIFSEYVHYLLSHGYPLGFYPEGGRSRTGFTLKPKTGMLSMVVQSAYRTTHKPILLVPIYIGYDKIAEGRSYIKELAGGQKQGESIGQLLKARKALKGQFGRAYLSFGKPIDLEHFVEKRQSNWRDLPEEDGKLPKALNSCVDALAWEIGAHINAAAALTPSALFTTILFATPKLAVPEETLLDCAKTFVSILKDCPSLFVHTDHLKDLKGKLSYVEKLIGLGRFSYTTGDVIYIDERSKYLLTYYKNNTLHLFLVPSIIASFFQNEKKPLNKSLIVTNIQALYKLFQSELFLRWDLTEIESLCQHFINRFIENGLLIKNDEESFIHQSDPHYSTILRLLASITSSLVESYGVCAQILKKFEKDKLYERSYFEEDFLKSLERVILLTGACDGVCDRNKMMSYLKQMENFGYYQTKEEQVRLDPSLQTLIDATEPLLKQEMRQIISY